jgi:hypothetical protein
VGENAWHVAADHVNHRVFPNTSYVPSFEEHRQQCLAKLLKLEDMHYNNSLFH